jgi:hypothetical protein
MMLSEFGFAGKAARNAIAVPALSIESIRRRARAGSMRERVRGLAAVVTIAIALLGAGVVGAKIYGGIEIWLKGDEGSVAVHSLVMVRNPRPDELRQIAASATFPVVFPVGVPAGSRILRVMYSPADHPSSINVDYGFDPSFRAGFLIIDPSLVHNAEQPGATRSGPVYHWRVGRQIVIVPKRVISQSDVARVQVAMAASSPTESLNAAIAMLPRVWTLGAGGMRMSIAERLAPKPGLSVLLDSQWVRSIAQRRARGEALRDQRTITIAHIPNAGGVPEYAKATGISMQNVMVVSVGGVRGIDAVLSASGTNRADCACEVLFYQPNTAAYWVWIIPTTGPEVARKYTVDAATLAVSPQP